MRIRSVTYFIKLGHDRATWEPAVDQAIVFVRRATEAYVAAGYEVQTLRIATNSFENYMDCSTFDSLLQDALHLEGLCIKHGVEFVGIGPAIDPHIIEWIPKLIAGTKYIFCSFATPHNMEVALGSKLGAAILDVAALTDGIGSFRFAVLSNMQYGCPFFPAAYHPGDADEPLFALATENTPILRQAMEASQGSLDLATKRLTTYLQHAFDPVLQIAEALDTVTVETKSGAPQDEHPRFLGIDASVAPGPGTPTITGSYELMGLGRFGDPGTLAVTSAITSALKSLSVPLIGYSGLMLPVCEDKGLAQRADEGLYTMGDLIKYSAVCGCGLDTVPIPGDCDVTKIAAILLDVNALAFKLNKPLTIRLMPVPGKKAGDLTEFDNPFLVNCKVFDL